MGCKNSKKTTKKKSINIFKWRIIACLLLSIVLGGGVSLVVFLNNQGIEIKFTSNYELSPDQKPAQIEYGLGEITEEIPTVEYVESTSPVVEISETECPESEECGRGAVYPSLDISTPQAFANEVLNQCINVDGYYGSQCWDLMAAFWYNYTGRTLTTCGTGAAKGAIADGCWQINAGDEFEMIWNKEDVKDGDIAFYSTGQWGHTGMAMGSYNNGYFTLLGQNQGGASCPGGGGAANIINLSTRDFIGAFRPKIYIEPEPTPIPVSNCVLWHVERGDTMSKIMMECEGTIKYGEVMNEYAKTWYSLIMNPGQSVYDGWSSKNGIGLYIDDTIEHRL